MREQKKTRPAGGTAEQAKRESHRRGGNPYQKSSTELGGGQAGGIASLLLEGSENGLHLQDLVRLTGEDQRTVRKMIHQERRRGIPILSNSKDGYYLPGNEYEKAECVRQMRGRAREILAAARAIEKAVEQ